MADVKWIKLATQVFDNRKIKQIERMPDGDSIIVVWIKLLCLAGTINGNGMIYLTDEIPYTEEMLAAEFNMEQRISTLKLALRTFEKFGMIRIVDSVYYISSWEKYQNIEGLEKIREQNRIRKQNQRDRDKLIECHVTCHEEVTQCHATDIDIEEDKDKDIKNKEKKHKFGEFGHVRLKESESNRLISELGQSTFDKCIKKLDEYIQETGKKYKDHNLTIRRWVIESVKENKPNQQPKTTNKFNHFPQRDYSAADYSSMEQKLLSKG